MLNWRVSVNIADLHVMLTRRVSLPWQMLNVMLKTFPMLQNRSPHPRIFSSSNTPMLWNQFLLPQHQADQYTSVILEIIDTAATVLFSLKQYILYGSINYIYLLSLYPCLKPTQLEQMTWKTVVRIRQAMGKLTACFSCNLNWP